MNSVQKNYIEFELANYQRNLQTLQDLDKHTDLNSIVWQRLRLVTEGITLALADLTPELQRFMQLKYGQNKHYTTAGLAYQLHVSERTIQRWHNEVCYQVAKYIGF
ncbi:hypothetical protein [Succinispira mobilis]|uniref:hypothetical protein n=1 Tax=Succinispira mobilis TaxID=78120 RepID=UPI00037AE799|nr:hypothetical protein [Succinispira mobilis]